MKAENIELVRKLCSDRNFYQDKIKMISQPKVKINFSLACDNFGSLSMSDSSIPEPLKNYIKRQIVLDYEKQILEIDKQLESL